MFCRFRWGLALEHHCLKCKRTTVKQEVWQQDWLARWALYRPEKAALQEHEEGRMIQYRDLNALANGMASYLLTQHGVKKGIGW